MTAHNIIDIAFFMWFFAVGVSFGVRYVQGSAVEHGIARWRYPHRVFSRGFEWIDKEPR